MALRLSLEDVSYSYPLPGKAEAAALSGVSLVVEPGEVLCVAGSNGSGKSTLAQLVAGLLTPGSGTMSYGGEPVRSRTDLRELRRKVGLLFQAPEDQLFADTVEKDIAFGPRNHGVHGQELEAAIREAAGLVGLPLERLGKRSPFSLSEGEKRRVALAGVLATGPDLLVLDEPFIGLDFDGRERLKEALARYREERGASVMIVTHELAHTWALADRFALLHEGKLRGLENRADLVSGEADLAVLGMQLPQWGLLARALLELGLAVEDPADPHGLALAIAQHRGGHGR